jgi:hypothetical protein
MYGRWEDRWIICRRSTWLIKIEGMYIRKGNTRYSFIQGSRRKCVVILCHFEYRQVGVMYLKTPILVQPYGIHL